MGTKQDRETAGMTKCVWIASFPKSGNTWLRFIIADMLFHRSGSSQMLQKIAPGIHRARGQVVINPEDTFKGLGFIKTHFPASPELDAVGAKNIHITRNPLDVLASVLNFYAIPAEKTPAVVEEFCATKTIAQFAGWGFGDWSGHRQSWAQSANPTLLLTYEALSRDPFGVYRQIAEFLDAEISEADLVRIEANTAFTTLARLETAERRSGVGIFHRDVPSSFMNKGVVGNYKAVFSPAQIDMMEAVFGAEIDKYGLR